MFDRKCGLCPVQDGFNEQRVYPVYVDVERGLAILRCSNHLNFPARVGEAKPLEVA
ncbi:MAG: hypothetical protein WC325_11495 [Candidatus Bathyarchaeia archaeon]|jgi:hypothetical protein